MVQTRRMKQAAAMKKCKVYRSHLQEEVVDQVVVCLRGHTFR